MTRVMVRIEDRSDWWHNAGCLGTDPEVFFPVSETAGQVEQAKAICRRCDVTEECLSWALQSGQDHGVWGGMTPAGRRAYLRGER